MKRVKRVKGLALLVSLVVILIFLTGCRICIDIVCPPAVVHPQILSTIHRSELLSYAREWAPLADYRWMKSEWYELCSKADIEWILNKIGWGIEPFVLINLVHSQPGYENIPFGYVRYYWGQYSNVVVAIQDGRIKAFIVTASGKLIEPVGAVDGLMELIKDYNITEIVI